MEETVILFLFVNFPTLKVMEEKTSRDTKTAVQPECPNKWDGMEWKSLDQKTLHSINWPVWDNPLYTHPQILWIHESYELQKLSFIFHLKALF